MTQPATAETAALTDVGAVFDHAAHAAHRIRDLLPIYADLLGGGFIQGGDNPRVGYRAIQLGFSDGTKIELLEPLRDSRFLTRFLARGGGLHHITFKVRDIRRGIERMREIGYTPVGVYLDDPNWLEAFLHPRDAHGALIQLAQQPPDSMWGPGMDVTLDEVLAGRGPHGNGEVSP